LTPKSNAYDESTSDEELMAAYQQGDDQAFGLLYQRHSGKVYGFLMNRLKDQQTANDVFQATFMKLHAARSHYDPSFPFVPWLFTVCKSVLVDSVRKRNRVKEDHNQEALENAVAQEPTPESTIPDLSALSQPQRQAIEFRYGQELSFEDIAKRLETSPTNVRQMVSRAVKKLRALSNPARRSK
jgi:RNA polymerase sigma factor (sigma-70 family)